MFYLFSTYPTYGNRGCEGCPGSWAQANIDCGSIFVGGMEHCGPGSQVLQGHLGALWNPTHDRASVDHGHSVRRLLLRAEEAKGALARDRPRAATGAARLALSLVAGPGAEARVRPACLRRRDCGPRGHQTVEGARRGCATAGDRHLVRLDAVGVLVSEVYKLEASIGLIGPL